MFRLSPERVFVQTTTSLSFATLSDRRLDRYLDWGNGLNETTWARKIRRAARRHRPA